MNTESSNCEHRFRYYVEMRARAVRMKRCELCGLRVSVAAAVPVAVPA